MNIHFVSGRLLALALSMVVSSVLVSEQIPPEPIQDPTGAQAQGQQGPNESELTIENESPLPDTYPHADYELPCQRRGASLALDG